MKLTISVVLVSVMVGAACTGQPPAEDQATGEMQGPSEAAISRTREQARMLDDLYKTAVVLITDNYVNDPSSVSGASIAKALFGQMDANGWHEVRLLGLTEVRTNPANAPSDDFETTAAERLLAGDTSYEMVVEEDGMHYLRYATPIPVVMEKCVMCHANFEGNTGAVGALSYKLPVTQ